jgi:hypothetical protein
LAFWNLAGVLEGRRGVVFGIVVAGLILGFCEALGIDVPPLGLYRSPLEVAPSAEGRRSP